jgi:hypothetical protein
MKSKKIFIYAALLLAPLVHEGGAIPDDYSTYDKIINADPQSMSRYIDDFVRNPEQRTLKKLKIILDRLAFERTSGQKNSSYFDGMKKLFSKSEIDRFWGVFNVKGAESAQWLKDLRSALYNIESIPEHLDKLKKEIIDSPDRSISFMLRMIGDYKEAIKRYASSQEKAKKMIAMANVNETDSLDQPLNNSWFGTNSLDQLDQTEKSLSTYNVLLQGNKSIRIPSLEQVDDDLCAYFSEVIGVIDQLAQADASYKSSRNGSSNPFMDALSSQEKDKIEGSINQAKKFIQDFLVHDIDVYFNKKSKEYTPRVAQQENKDQVPGVAQQENKDQVGRPPVAQPLMRPYPYYNPPSYNPPNPYAP